MKTRVLILCIAVVFSSTQVFSQLSKKEKKEWKKVAKEYSKNPENLKALLDNLKTVESDNAALKDQINTLNDQANTKNDQIATLNQQLTDKNTVISDLEGEVAKARREMLTAKAEGSQTKQSRATNSNDYSSGVVFRVQIGAVTNRDLSKYFDNNPNFGGEAAGVGEQRITIGIFRDYAEANEFKKYMREMGVKDAWIAPYKDGQRVELNQVLDGVGSDGSNE